MLTTAATNLLRVKRNVLRAAGREPSLKQRARADDLVGLLKQMLERDKMQLRQLQRRQCAVDAAALYAASLGSLTSD